MLNTLLLSLATRLQAVREEEGQTMVEYALILSLISVAAILVLPGVGTAVSGIFTTVTGSL